MKLSGNPYLVFIAVIIIGLVAASLYFRGQRQRRIRRMLRSRWGEPNERKFSANELLMIRWQAGFLAGERGFTVDDITWNDLDMDRLFAAADTTFTDAGDAELYRMLRNPLANAEELKSRGKIMAWAAADPDSREKIKRVLYDLGRTGRLDLGAMFERDWFDRKRWLMCIALSVSLAALIVLCAFGVWAASFPAVVIAAVNAVTSFRSRAETGKYFSLFQYVPSVLYAAGKVAEAQTPALEDANNRIRENLGRIKGILGNNLLNYYYSFNNRSVNNPLDVLLATFNVFFLIDVISMYNLSRHIFRYKNEIVDVFETLGAVDALIAAASFRETMADWCEPEFEAGQGMSISFEGIAHPLLKDPVTNSLEIKRNVLLTGSNATGKSTFLKTVAINAILAQSLDTCSAEAWKSGFFRVYTSMALRDDLFSHESYFITEIKSLKRMLDSVSGEVPSLCIVDEVLRGTNTGERIAAASEALRMFAAGRCLCLAATHDAELTYILENLFENMHFSETITDGGIAFDYKLKPGRSMSRNAIKLLELLGYGRELVDAANTRLENFEKTGRWQRATSE